MGLGLAAHGSEDHLGSRPHRPIAREHLAEERATCAGAPRRCPPRSPRSTRRCAPRRAAAHESVLQLGEGLGEGGEVVQDHEQAREVAVRPGIALVAAAIGHQELAPARVLGLKHADEAPDLLVVGGAHHVAYLRRGGEGAQALGAEVDGVHVEGARTHPAHERVQRPERSASTPESGVPYASRLPPVENEQVRSPWRWRAGSSKAPATPPARRTPAFGRPKRSMSPSRRGRRAAAPATAGGRGRPPRARPARCARGPRGSRARRPARPALSLGRTETTEAPVSLMRTTASSRGGSKRACGAYGVPA